MRTDADLLTDILEAVAAIEKYQTVGNITEDRRELTRVWNLYHLQIIGEAVVRLSDDLKSVYTNVPWREIVAMRNILVHAYFGIDDARIQAAIDNDLMPLKSRVSAILAAIQSTSQSPPVATDPSEN